MNWVHSEPRWVSLALLKRCIRIRKKLKEQYKVKYTHWFNATYTSVVFYN